MPGTLELFIPTDNNRKKFYEHNTNENIELATTVAWLGSMFNKSFVSTQGLPPDFRLGFQIENGFLMRGVYTPILNQLGFDADIAAVEGTPYVLAWSTNRLLIICAVDSNKKRPDLCGNRGEVLYFSSFFMPFLRVSVFFNGADI